MGIDLDKLAIDILSSSVIQDETQYSQEFRIASPDLEFGWMPGSFNFTLGAYYYELANDARIEVPLYSGLVDVVRASLVPQPVTDVLGLLALPQLPKILDLLSGDFYLETESTAIFGQADWSITETVSLILGLRQSKDVKKIFLDVQSSGPVPFFPQITDAPFLVDKTNVFKDFSPKLSVTWDATEDITTYLTFAEGFRAGSVNAGASERQNV